MARQARQWFRAQNKADDPTVYEIHIVDIIGDWIDELINEFYGMKATLTAKAFIDQLAKISAGVTTIRVHINSPGGDVFAAANIANALRDQQLSKNRTVETIVDGLAASAASVIAMAGSKVTMADNAIFMIHQPWSMAVGNAAEMRKAASTLDAITASIVTTYQWHSNKSAEEIVAMMDAESWLSADEAIDAGFVTDKIDGLKAAASIDPKAAAGLKVPDKYRDRVQALLAPTPAEPVKATAGEILAQCKAGGCLDLAEELLTAGATLDQVKAKVTATKTAKDAEASRVATITAMCTEFRQPELASDYIAGGMSLEKVKAQLAIIRSKQDRVEIDAGLTPDQRPSQVTAGWKSAFARVTRGGAQTRQ